MVTAPTYSWPANLLRSVPVGVVQLSSGAAALGERLSRIGVLPDSWFPPGVSDAMLLEAQETWPTQPGASAFVGQIAGQALVPLPGVAIPGALGRIAGRGALGLFGVVGAGYMSKEVEAQRAKGMAIGPGHEAVALLGAGLVSVLTEGLGMAMARKAVGRLTGPQLQILGRSMLSRDPTVVSSALTMAGMPFKEGFQELSEEVLHNAIQMTFDKEQQLMAHGLEAFAGGMIGGTMQTGAGAILRRVGRIGVKRPAWADPKMTDAEVELARPLAEAGLFRKIIKHDRPIYAAWYLDDPTPALFDEPVEDGWEIWGYMATTGEMHLASSIDSTTIGHEAFHALLYSLGQDDPVMQRGLALTGGDVEALCDLVGAYHAQRMLPTNVAQDMGRFMKDLVVRGKQMLGVEMTRAQTMSAINMRLRERRRPRPGEVRDTGGFPAQQRRLSVALKMPDGTVRTPHPDDLRDYGRLGLGHAGLWRRLEDEIGREKFETIAGQITRGYIDAAGTFFTEQEVESAERAARLTRGPEGPIYMQQKLVPALKRPDGTILVGRPDAFETYKVVHSDLWYRLESEVGPDPEKLRAMRKQTVPGYVDAAGRFFTIQEVEDARRAARLIRGPEGPIYMQTARRFTGDLNIEHILADPKLLDEMRQAFKPLETTHIKDVEAEAAKYSERQVVDLMRALMQGRGLTMVEGVAVRQAALGTLAQAQLALLQEGLSAEEQARLQDVKTTMVEVAQMEQRTPGFLLRYQQENIDPFLMLEVAVQDLARPLTARERGLMKDMTQEIARLMKGRKHTEARMLAKEFTYRLTPSTFWERLSELYRAGLVSGLPTHLVNITDTFIHASEMALRRPVEGAIDYGLTKLGLQKQRQIYMGSIWPMLASISPVRVAERGFKVEIPMSLRLGKAEMIKALKGKSRDEANRLAFEMAYPFVSAFERHPGGRLLSKEMATKLAPVIQLPLRCLIAGDLLIKTPIYHMFLQDAAYQKAASELAKRGVRPRHSEIRREMRKWMDNERVMQRAAEQAQRATFNDMPGPLTQMAIRARNEHPPAFLVVPFINTLTNILKGGLERTPGLGLAFRAPAMKRALAGMTVKEARGRGVRLPAEVAVSQIEGLLLTFLVAWMWDDDDLVGPIPEDSRERAAFWRSGRIPNSFRVDDTYWSWERIEPYSVTFRTLLEARDAVKNAKDDATRSDIMWNASYRVGRSLTETGFLDNIGRMMSEYGAKRAVLRMPSTLVPYSSMFRNINRTLDAAFGDRTVVDDENFWKYLAQTLPLKSEWIIRHVPGFNSVAEFLGAGKQRPRLDIWGEKVELPGGIFAQWVPYRRSPAKDDPVERMLKEIDRYPGLPRQNFTIGGREFPMSDDMYLEYSILYGAAGKRMLRALVQRPGFGALPVWHKTRIVNRMLEAARRPLRARAKVRMLQELRAGK